MIELSPLPKTWIFDVDGTLVIHNGHLKGCDILLPGVKEAFHKIPVTDKIILMTARGEEHKEALQKFLLENDIRFDTILFGMPTGERILVNDRKPSGLVTAVAINKNRDSKLELDFVINEDL